MNIKHEPLFETEKVIEHYREKDGVDISYVCTTALKNETVSVDVFYRDTPHPEFGNRYFGLYESPFDGHLYICNADSVEEYDFGMALHEGEYYYSQHRHDFRPVGTEGAIDGGRAYVRSVGNLNISTFKVKDGSFIEVA